MREGKNSSTNYLTKFSMDLNGIWHTVETCWCDETHTHFISYFSVFKGGNPTYGIAFEKTKVGLCSDIYRPISFRLGRMIETTKLYILICLDDLDVHSRSKLYEKSKTLISIFSQIGLSIWIRFSMLPQPLSLYFAQVM